MKTAPLKDSHGEVLVGAINLGRLWHLVESLTHCLTVCEVWWGDDEEARWGYHEERDLEPKCEGCWETPDEASTTGARDG